MDVAPESTRTHDTAGAASRSGTKLRTGGRHILKAKKLGIPFQPDMSNFEAIEAFSLISAKALEMLV